MQAKDETAQPCQASRLILPDCCGEVLAGSLDKVGRFRLLLGKDYELASKASKRSEEQRIKEMVRLALREEMQAIALPTAVDADSVRRLLKFLSRPDTEVDFRVFEGGGEFLHAKAYILSGSVGVGSANFTASGLLRNRELVAWRQDRHVVTELNAWFDTLWSQGRPYKDELRQIISSSRFGDRAWTPFEWRVSNRRRYLKSWYSHRYK